jgi:hypothetical protein
METFLKLKGERNPEKCGKGFLIAVIREEKTTIISGIFPVVEITLQMRCRCNHTAKYTFTKGVPFDEYEALYVFLESHP